MGGALRKTMEYLGLAEVDPAYPDDRYRRGDDAYDDYYEDEGPHGDARHDDEYAPEQQIPAEVTPLPRRASAPHSVREMSHSEVAGMNRIMPIHPRTYNEAKTIGESFREGIPVIMNLTDMDDNDAKRLVDFAAGLVFGLHGTIERVTSKVFLLSPTTVEVASQSGQASKNARVLFNQS
ncbi:cell division protein SepF [Demetria terragena]|uniref:cell division protein SepF n=1 Tax=Demetria terragena TaxID=63959 RepID=UPI00036BB8AE|nr:cell division protein SepF [Demetria terragena]